MTAWIYYLLDNKILPIKYDKNTDDKEFIICNEDLIPQYYSVETNYVGGKTAIKKILLPIINQDKITFGLKSGYVSIRFVVNCNGETGLFRANEIDENIQSTKFDKSKIEKLKKTVSRLDNWDVKTKFKKQFDSYYFINFKIENGKITDIF